MSLQTRSSYSIAGHIVTVGLVIYHLERAFLIPLYGLALASIFHGIIGVSLHATNKV